MPIRLVGRERLFVTAAVIAVLFAVTFQVFVRPRMNRIRTLEQGRSAHEENLRVIRQVAQRYMVLKDKITNMQDRMARQPKDFAILSFLEAVGRECGLTQNVVHMKPATASVATRYAGTTVEIKLEGVTLEQIAQFLQRVGAAEALVGVKSLTLRTSRDGRLLDADLEVGTVALGASA